MKKNIFAIMILIAFFAAGEFAHANAEVQCVQLRSSSQTGLDQMYQNASAGKIPEGSLNGCAISWSGKGFTAETAELISGLWQGKVFNGETSTLQNNILGFEMVQADVYLGESQMDGKPAIIIDYSKESFPFFLIRDEIREVSPGFYLGRAYFQTLIGSVLAVNFALFK